MSFIESPFSKVLVQLVFVCTFPLIVLKKKNIFHYKREVQLLSLSLEKVLDFSSTLRYVSSYSTIKPLRYYPTMVRNLQKFPFNKKKVLKEVKGEGFPLGVSLFITSWDSREEEV